MLFSLLLSAEGVFTQILRKDSFRITYDSSLENPNDAYGKILFGDFKQDPPPDPAEYSEEEEKTGFQFVLSEN